MKCLSVPVALCFFLSLGAALRGADDADRAKSVTVYPVVISPSENISAAIPQRIAEVVGLQLERAGMERVEMGETPFTPPDTADVAELGTAFGRFVADQQLQTQYAVFAQIFGTPGVGISEIRTIVVDKSGQPVLGESAKEQEFAQSKIQPKNPMTASLFVVERLGTVWKLADPMRKDAPQGKMADLMRKRSGLPAQDELVALAKRLEAEKGKISSSTVTIYPVHLWTGSDDASAADLVKLLNEKGICQAEVSAQVPQLEVKGDPNEQKVLWDTARQFRAFVRDNPPATEYALLADYGLSPTADGQKVANHVHLILCNRAGDWVLVDYQNSHHADFQGIEPRSCADCNQLSAKRLENLLSK